MIDVEPVIIAGLEQMLPLPDGRRADWADVLQRAGIARVPARLRVSRRTLVALATAVLVGLAIAVPASGLPQTVINWLSAPAAPGPTQKSFQSLDTGAPAGMSPHVSGSARSVMEARIAGEDVNLWVAPTAGGGFCVLLQGYGGGCDRDRQLPLMWSVADHTAHTPPVISGDALSPETDHMRLHFATGQSVSIPVVSVSDPINASFFVYQVTTAAPQADGWPATLEAVSPDGKVLASATLNFALPPSPSH